MRIIPRLLLVAALLAVMFYFIEHLRHLQAIADAVGEELDMSKRATYYFIIIGLGAVTAVITCVSLLPMLGEFIGGFLFHPNIKIERSPHAEALAKLAAGDFEGAIAEYKSVVDDDPKDMHAVSEVVRLYCEKLNKPEPAEDFLVEVLSMADWEPAEKAFLSQRLVDVSWTYHRDVNRARAILIKIAEDMPETREAANALHRLQEIERVFNEEEHRKTADAPQSDDTSGLSPSIFE